MTTNELIEELRFLAASLDIESHIAQCMTDVADRLAALTTGRAEIAEQVRRHCTLPSEVLHAGSDAIVRAVADWIENPPEWVPPVAALTTPQEGDAHERLAAVLEVHNDTMHPDDQKKCGCGKTIGYAEGGAIYRYEQEHLMDEIFTAFPVLSRDIAGEIEAGIAEYCSSPGDEWTKGFREGLEAAAEVVRNGR